MSPAAEVEARQVNWRLSPWPRRDLSLALRISFVNHDLPFCVVSITPG